jgi:hypothetical protein
MPDPKLPGEDEDEIEERAKEARKDIDDPPPHGTDPLHEGP